jgi:hypothetical protein
MGSDVGCLLNLNYICKCRLSLTNVALLGYIHSDAFSVLVTTYSV